MAEGKEADFGKYTPGTTSDLWPSAEKEADRELQKAERFNRDRVNCKNLKRFYRLIIEEIKVNYPDLYSEIQELALNARIINKSKQLTKVTEIPYHKHEQLFRRLLQYTTIGKNAHYLDQMKGRDEGGNVPAIGTPYNWDWNWLIDAGKFNFWFGPTGYGKTSGACGVILKLVEKFNIVYIGNLSYYPKVIKAHKKRMHKSNSMRKQIEIAMKTRIADDNTSILIVLDEAATRMNRAATIMNREEIGQIEAMAKQMRKLNITILAIFQDQRDISPMFRTKHDEPSTHSAYFIHHGMRPVNDGWGTGLEPLSLSHNTHKKGFTIEFSDPGKPPVFIPNAPDNKRLFNTEQPADFTNDFDFIQWVRDISNEVKDASGEKGKPAWRKRMAEATTKGIDEGRWYFEERKGKVGKYKEKIKEIREGHEAEVKDMEKDYKDKIKEMKEDSIRKEYYDIKTWKETNTWKKTHKLHEEKYHRGITVSGLKYRLRKMEGKE